uniref:G-protein coupled receptors family 1 profile domain-containing protein n=1 Tax=Panagrolaimus sp. ES5 TaxID=591445 RepID=A0AC34FP50_9BILA
MEANFEESTSASLIIFETSETGAAVASGGVGSIINVYRFETSSALPLCAMSICDSLCLISQFAQAIFHMIVNWKFSSPSADYYYTSNDLYKLSFFCKIDMFIMHATSAYSVWCWLMLSVLRYTAVFHPFKYRTIWRQPRNALLIIAASSCTLELWILVLVSYLPEERSCIESPGTHAVTAQAGHLMDILFAYVIPSFIRILLDGIVLSHCYRPNIIEVPVFERRYGISSASGQALLISNENKNPISLILSLPRQSISYKREQFCKKKNSMIMRSLIISALNLCCNLPSHVLRAVWTLESAPQMNETLMSFLEAISQLLYFGQFTCNAFYLSTTIYETSTAPTKTYSTTNHSKINVSKYLENEEV